MISLNKSIDYLVYFANRKIRQKPFELTAIFNKDGELSFRHSHHKKFKTTVNLDSPNLIGIYDYSCSKDYLTADFQSYAKG